MVRILGVALLAVMFPLVPTEAKSIQQNCKGACSTAYHFCLKRALTGQGRADCKKVRKQCKGTCGK